MTSISLGPLALPTGPLLLFAAAALAVFVADRRRWRADGDAGADTGTAPARARPGGTLVTAVWLGLAAARLVHVALHHDAYLAEPLAVLDVRDGGWHAPGGLAVAAAWVAWQAVRHAPWRRALAAGSAAGLAAWAAGSLWLASASAGATLPDVVLTDLATGRPVRLHDAAAGRPVVLNLWATWCAPCRRELPVLADGQRRHPEVVFVFANQGEDAAAVRRFLAAEGLDLRTVLLDPASSLGPAVGSTGLPTTVFHDAQGRRVDAHLGLLNAAALAARVRAIVPSPASP